jgi:CheY-like chemotaxis protein
MPTRILIVEDEAVTALDLKRELMSLGYKVAGIADNATDAVNSAASLKPDLVLMDIHLSGSVDGIAAASAIRGNDDIPVVFLTAHSDQVTLDRALTAAPFGYVLKPFLTRELKVSIEVALYKHTKEAEIRALVVDLEAALARVKLLSGLVPICATCKNIRDADGRWIPIEEYIHDHSEADFTHGVCPKCEAQIMARLEAEPMD